MIDVQLTPGGPITQMDEALAEKREGGFENDHEKTAWVEYWLEGNLIHRSAHVHLKETPSIGVISGSFA